MCFRAVVRASTLQLIYSELRGLIETHKKLQALNCVGFSAGEGRAKTFVLSPIMFFSYFIFKNQLKFAHIINSCVHTCSAFKSIFHTHPEKAKKTRSEKVRLMARGKRWIANLNNYVQFLFFFCLRELRLVFCPYNKFFSFRGLKFMPNSWCVMGEKKLFYFTLRGERHNLMSN